MTGAPAFLPGAGPGRCTRPDFASRLTTFDELDPETRAELDRHALACPVCGPALRLFKRTDQWIEGHGPAPSTCPSAEELFDYARAPGSHPMVETLRRVVETHLTSCGSCRQEIATLERNPPLPLDLSALPVELAQDPQPRPKRAFSRVAVGWSLAAAAAVMLGWLWLQRGPSQAGNAPMASSDKPQPQPASQSTANQIPAPPGGELVATAVPATIQFPKSELLRSQGASGALYPRGQVLRSSKGELHFGLAFEVTSVERVTQYRFDLTRHSGSVFGNPIQKWRIDSQHPIAHWDAAVQGALEPGHYTWTAWATVDGLDLEIGRRDFEIVQDPELEQQLLQAQRPGGNAGAQAVLMLLHQRGFWSDARVFARTLPDSPEKTQYLLDWAQR